MQEHQLFCEIEETHFNILCDISTDDIRSDPTMEFRKQVFNAIFPIRLTSQQLSWSSSNTFGFP
jgi:hypothetical protein